jgi:hypothetical protein
MKREVQLFRFSNLESFTAKVFTTFLLLFLTHYTSAQWRDDFSDDDFTHNPAWTGSSEKFTVTGGMLRLHAPAATGTAYLSTPSTVIANIEWQFRVRMEFNPSNQNHVRVYLASSQPDLSGSLNGYYVLIGNNTDEISLFRQSGGTRTKIITGQSGRVNLPLVDVTIKVTRDGTGKWQLWSDVGRTGEFLSEGSVTDPTFTTSSFFGVFCAYTSANASRFL